MRITGERFRHRLRHVAWLCLALALVACGGAPATLTLSAPTSTEVTAAAATPGRAVSPSGARATIQTVFIIVMENHNWADIKGSRAAPYLNGTLLPLAAHAEQYFNPPGLHPSLPNYLWLEAGTNFGVRDDLPPTVHHQPTTEHLVTQLERAGISWKAYQEDISGTSCPLTATGRYAPKHNPMVYFADVTGGNNSQSAYCIAHERPYTELAGDLAHNTVARYNFITPNLCHDMHDTCGFGQNAITQGDNWLASEVPKILASAAYQRGGVLFITWDEGEGSDGPIGLLVLSPFAKPGYQNSIHYTHSSLLATVQEIFGVGPLLGDAAHATDLSDLFTVPLSP
ncbi:MAG: alkaline phosphatase family protein [Thermomicrobiales bacterium]